MSLGWFFVCVLYCIYSKWLSSAGQLYMFLQLSFILQWKKIMYHKVVIKFFNLILTDVNSERGWHSANESPEVWHDWRHGHAYAPQWGLCSFQPQPSLQFLDDLCETRPYHFLFNIWKSFKNNLRIKFSVSLMFFIAFGSF